MSAANEASTLDAIVMSLQPCPHCGAMAVDAYKKTGDYGMDYFLIFEKKRVYALLWENRNITNTNNY